jgi:hypothetical protein
MQPCAVCGSVTIDAAGHCTQCGTFRGGGPAPGGYGPPQQYGGPESYGGPGPQGYGQPVSGSPGYGQPVSGSPGYGQPVSGTPGYGHPVSGSSGYGQPANGGTGYPTSGPPGGYPTSGAPGYAPPTSGGGYPTTYPPPPGGGGGSRTKPFVVPLVALSVTLVVLVVAIVIVVLVRGGSKETPTGGPGPGPVDTSAATSSDVDSCVVGQWKVTSHKEAVSIPEVGEVQFTGGDGGEIELRADGTGHNDYGDGTSYEGTADGATFRLEIRGTVDYEFSARDGTLSIRNIESDATAQWYYNGKENGSERPFEGSTDPANYECSGDSLVEKTNEYEATYTRIS